METGYTFIMMVELVYPLNHGSIWQLVEEPKENAEIPRYKSTGKFARLKFSQYEGLRLATKGKSNIIRLSVAAIERYLELGYIKKYWEEWHR